LTSQTSSAGSRKIRVADVASSARSGSGLNNGETHERIEHQDVTRPDQADMDQPEAQQHDHASQENSTAIGAARFEPLKLQREPQAEQRGEDGIKFAIEHSVEDCYELLRRHCSHQLSRTLTGKWYPNPNRQVGEQNTEEGEAS
jgi:hypothetical protein